MAKSVSKMDLNAEGILGEFEGTPVTRSGSKVNNATKALNNTLEVSPLMAQKGDTGFVVFQYEVVSVNFPNVQGHEDQSRRVHTLHLTDAALLLALDSTLIEKAINVERDKIRRAQEAVSGTQRIIVDDDGEPKKTAAPVAKAAQKAQETMKSAGAAAAAKVRPPAKPKSAATVTNIADATPKP
jgi:hypothetical protein